MLCAEYTLAGNGALRHNYCIGLHTGGNASKAFPPRPSEPRAGLTAADDDNLYAQPAMMILRSNADGVSREALLAPARYFLASLNSSMPMPS